MAIQGSTSYRGNCNAWARGVITEGAATPHRELLHNYDTSLKPTAGFRGALRRGDLKVIVATEVTLCNHSARTAAGECTLLFNITDDETESTDLAAQLPDVAQQMRQRLEQLGNEAVPCWGGTGSVANPAGFRGDCDAHPPKMNCTVHTPAVYEPGWCVPTGPPSPSPSPGPPSPSPPGEQTDISQF